MSIKKNTLRILRNTLYRRYKKAGERFRKVNRSFLRTVSPDAAPIADAVTITDRRTDEAWIRLQPVWVLSTGRTGTNTLTELLKLSPFIDAFHEPAPELFQFSHDYYSGNISGEEALRALQYLRDELVFRSSRDGFIYVETNNRVTYVADLLLELYPQSKFIFVHRNPYEFIRSGMRRGYYQHHMRDSARIQPLPDDACHGEWENWSEIEKVAWNWSRVNAYCLEFVQELPDNQKMVFSAESFFSGDQSLINNLFHFIGSEDYRPPKSDVERVMGKKHNAQRQGSFSKPKDWRQKQLENVERIIASVAAELCYPLLSEKTGY
jgi:hypothetical protein